MKRPRILLVINVVIAVYFTLMHFRLIPKTNLTDVINDLAGIPFLITLVISTIISARDFRATGFKNGIFSFLAFMTGLLTVVFLIIITVYPSEQTL